MSIPDYILFKPVIFRGMEPRGWLEIQALMVKERENHESVQTVLAVVP